MSVRLACVRHAASVHPEPGSNSRLSFLCSAQKNVIDSVLNCVPRYQSLFDTLLRNVLVCGPYGPWPLGSNPSRYELAFTLRVLSVRLLYWWSVHSTDTHLTSGLRHRHQMLICVKSCLFAFCFSKNSFLNFQGCIAVYFSKIHPLFLSTASCVVCCRFSGAKYILSSNFMDVNRFILIFLFFLNL